MDDYPTGLIAAGLAAVALAVIAWRGDRRRMRRSQPDAVGLMPWTAVFIWAVFAACMFTVLAVKEWLGR